MLHDTGLTASPEDLLVLGLQLHLTERLMRLMRKSHALHIAKSKPECNNGPVGARASQSGLTTPPCTPAKTRFPVQSQWSLHANKPKKLFPSLVHGPLVSFNLFASVGLVNGNGPFRASFLPPRHPFRREILERVQLQAQIMRAWPSR
jgi:hypothetical protein